MCLSATIYVSLLQHIHYGYYIGMRNKRTQLAIKRRKLENMCKLSSFSYSISPINNFV